jgi:hypothetical protein
MRQYVLISLLMVVGLVLVSCGPKRVQEKVIKNLSEQCDTQAKAADPFAELSLDDIRRNIECCDTEILIAGETPQDHGNRPIFSDEYEARLTDIAIPFGARLLDHYMNGEGQQQETVLGYLSTMPLADVVAFYTEHMERLGWSCASHVRGHEQLLLFEKPERSCSVVIRSAAHPKRGDTRLTKIVIFISQK